ALWAQNPQNPQTDPDNPVLIPGDNTAFGGTSAEFLEFGSGARGMALNGAFSTIVDDVNALHYNPAGLPLMDGPQAQVTIMPYFADTDYYWAGLAFPLSDGDFGVGFFLGRFGFGDSPVFTEADPNGTSGELFGVDEVVAGFSLAHAFIDRFSAGITFKFITDDLATGSLGGAAARTSAIDFGVNFHTELSNGHPIKVAFVVQNLGGDLTHSGNALRFTDITPDFPTQSTGIPDQRLDPTGAEVEASPFPLPRLFRIGLNYDILSGEQSTLHFMSEFVESNNQAPTVGVATEFEWEPMDTPVGAALRASWQAQPDARLLGGIEADGRETDGLRVGAGLFYKIAGRYRAAFDYAYQDLGVLGNVDVFSFTFGWN
ncbi:MAG: PorV/PorQ family protein, partial [Gemmatimonadota bacterium]